MEYDIKKPKDLSVRGYEDRVRKLTLTAKNEIDEIILGALADGLTVPGAECGDLVVQLKRKSLVDFCVKHKVTIKMASATEEVK